MTRRWPVLSVCAPFNAILLVLLSHPSAATVSTTTLQQGLNLVSIPVQLENYSIENVLSSIDGKYSHVRHFDATSGTWLSYSPERPAHLNTLTEFEYLKGYFIMMLSSGTLSIDGYTVPDDYHLSSGWNLVGAPYLEEQQADEFFARRYVHFSESIALNEIVEPPAFVSTSTLSPGRGYWLNVTDPGVSVNWVDPLPNPDALDSNEVFSIPGPDLHYILRATTTNPNVVECWFQIYWAISYDGYVCCPRDMEPGHHPGTGYEDIGGTVPVGLAAACDVDFSTATLIPLDTVLSLRAEMIDDTGSSGAAYTLVHVDNIAPAGITNLRAYYETASASEDRITLTWAATADNYAWNKRAASYVIKTTENTPILTEEDFENATTIAAGTSPADPGTTQTCVAGVFPAGDNATYYFQIKALDEVGNYSMSNVTTGTTRPYYEVTVDSIHYEYEGVTTHTVYLYDEVEVWGELTNLSSHTVNAEVRLYVSGVFDQQKTVLLAPGETGRRVSFDWIASDPSGSGYPRLDLVETGDGNHGVPNSQHVNVRVYSIVNDAVLEFSHPSDFPIPIELGNETGDMFYVWVRVENLDFTYNFPFHSVYYDFSATVNTTATISGTQTDLTGNILPASVGSPTVTWHPLEHSSNWYWIMESGPAGSVYNIQVYVGKDPRDRITIQRTVRIE